MKILLINKYYYNRGGSEKYLFELEKLLKAKGHQVRIFSMKHPKNLATPDSANFIKYHEFKRPTLWTYLKEGLGLFYRPESVRQLAKIVKDFQPDIAHLNNINFQLTTSIVDYLKKKEIPLVMTLHDYQLVCPNHLLFRQNHYCQACFPKKFYHCLLYRCYKNSLAQSLVATVESYFNHARRVYDKIDAFISPSQFLKQKMVEGGLPANKIRVWPNFLDLTGYANQKFPKDNYYLYAGRLTEDKGIKELIDTFSQNSHWQLKIVGDGPLQPLVLKSLTNNIKYHGHLTAEQVQQTLAQAKALILTSVWPENCPYIIIESLAAGTPVIATDVGGVAELVIDKVNGLLINNINQLPEVIAELEKNSTLLNGLTNQTKKTVIAYDAELYYQKLIALYQQF